MDDLPFPLGDLLPPLPQDYRPAEEGLEVFLASSWVQGQLSPRLHDPCLIHCLQSPDLGLSASVLATDFVTDFGPGLALTRPRRSLAIFSRRCVSKCVRHIDFRRS